jgi:hypothetical protein
MAVIKRGVFLVLTLFALVPNAWAQSYEKSCRALFHQVRFASDSLVAISALFLTLATAASIPSVVLLRRLRIRRAKSLVEIATRFRGGFGRYGVTMAVLHSIRTSDQTNFNLPTALL